MPWNDDLPGIVNVVDETSGSAVTMPTRKTIVFRGNFTITDDGNFTIINGDGGGGGISTVVTSASPGGLPAFGTPTLGKVSVIDGAGNATWARVPSSYIDNAEALLRGATVNAVQLFEKSVRLPVPEDYVPSGTSIASVDAAGNWQVYIQAMLDDVQAGGLTPNKSYVVSDVISPNAGNYLWGGEASSIAASSSFPGGTENMFDITSVSDVFIGNIYLYGNNKFDGASLVGHLGFVNSSSRITFFKCTFAEWGVASSAAQTFGVRVVGTSSEVVVHQCGFDAPTGVVGAGAGGVMFFTSGPTHSAVTDNWFNAPGLKNAVFVDGSCLGVQVHDNRMWDGFEGILIGYSSTATAFQVSVKDNVVYNMSGPGLYFTGANNSGVLAEGNTLAFCGGGFINFGRSAVVFAYGVDFVGNRIYQSGFDSSGAARTESRAAIEAAPSASDFVGKIYGNTIDGVALGTVSGVGSPATRGYAIDLQRAHHVDISHNTIRRASYGVIVGNPSLPSIHNLQVTHNTIDHTGLTGALVAVQLGQSSDTGRWHGAVIDHNQITGSASGSVYAAINVDQGKLGNGCKITANTVRSYTTSGVYIAASNSAYMFGDCDISGNSFNGSTNGVLVYCDSACPYQLVGPNVYTGVTNRVAGTGPSSGNVRECVSAVSGRKVIIATAVPTLASEGDFLAGDMIVGGAALKYCSTAGTGATAVWV